VFKKPAAKNYIRKEDALEENGKRTKHVIISLHQNAGQDHYVKVDNKSFVYIAKLRYFGMAVTDKNYIYK